MRRTRMVLTVTVLWLALTGTALAATMSVAVKEGAVRASASPFGKIVTTLRYGSRVEVGERKGAWVKVSLPGSSGGWMHSSSLSDKRLALQAGQETVRGGASADELTLAGKGFNAQVEGEYRQRNRELDYRWVDRMEALKIPADELQRFQREGHLGEGAGR